MSNRYDRWVSATSHALDALALIFLGVVTLNWLITPDLAWWQPVLDSIAFAIWVAFAVDYIVRLRLSVDHGMFFRTHLLDLVMVALPMLRLLRVVLVLRKAFRSISTEQIAGSLLSIVGVVVAAGAILEWHVEHEAPGASITTIGTAFWWAVVTTTTVGYGDTYPVTTAGRVIGTFIMVVGIGLIGTVSATVAAWFVTRKQRAADPPSGDATARASLQAVRSPSDVIALIEELSAQQQRLLDELRLLTAADGGAAAD